MAANAETLFAVDIDVSHAVASAATLTKSVENLAGGMGHLAPAAAEADAALDSVSKAMAEASGSASIWNKSLTDIASGFETSFDEMTGGAIRFSTVTGGLTAAFGVAAAGAAGLTAAYAYGVSEALEGEKATRQLTAALAAQGAATDENVRALTSQAAALQDATRFDDAAILQAEAALLRLGTSAPMLGKATQAAADLAAAMGTDITTAAEELGRTMDGTLGRLGEKIPQLQALTEAQLRNGDAMRVVADLYGGAAAADTQTLDGAMAQLHNTLGETAEAFAMSVTNTSSLAEAVHEARDFVIDITPQLREMGTVLGSVATQALAAGKELSFVASAMADEGILGTLFHSGQTNAALGQAATAFAGTPAGELEEAQDERVAAAAALAEARAKAEVIAHAKVWGEYESRFHEGDDIRLRGEKPEGWSAAFESEEGKAQFMAAMEMQVHELERALAAADGKIVSVRESLGAMKPEARQTGEAVKVTAGALGALSDAAGKSAKAIAHPTATALAEIQKLVNTAPGIAAQIAAMGLPVEDQAALLDKLGASGESARAKLDSLFTSGQLEDAGLYQGKLIELAMAMASVKESAAGIGLRALMERRTKEMAAGGDDLQALDADAAAGGPTAEETAHEVAAASADLEREALAALAVQLGDVDAAAAQYAIQQAEAALQTDIAAMAIDGLTAAEEREIAMRLKSIDAMKREAAQEKTSVAMKHALATAARGSASAALSAAISGSAASWKQLESDMKAKAKGEAVEAVIELALAAGSFAAHDHAGGAAHMQSAGLHGIAAGMAGGTAALAGAAGGGGGGDKGRRDELDSNSPFSSGRPSSRDSDFSRTREDIERGQAVGPSVSIIVNAEHIVGSTESLGRILAPVIQDAIGNQGGRIASRRL